MPSYRRSLLGRRAVQRPESGNDSTHLPYLPPRRGAAILIPLAPACAAPLDVGMGMELGGGLGWGKRAAGGRGRLGEEGGCTAPSDGERALCGSEDESGRACVQAGIRAARIDSCGDHSEQGCNGAWC
eukprot:gene10078-biopygen4664